MNIVTSLRFFHENNGIKCQISIKKNRNSRFAKLSRGRFIFNDISVLISDIRIYLNIVFVGMFHIFGKKLHATFVLLNIMVQC